MTALRRKMIEDFQIRHFAAGTQKSYLHCVARFAQHFGRSPDLLGQDDVRSFLLHLVNEAKVSYGMLCIYVSALRFLYKVTARSGHRDQLFRRKAITWSGDGDRSSERSDAGFSSPQPPRLTFSVS